MKKITFFLLLYLFLFITQYNAKGELIIDLINSIDSNKGKAETSNENKSRDIPIVKSDMITFNNRDKLHGKLISIIPLEGILWESPEVKEKILFSNKKADKITFGNKLQINNASNSSIVLTNGDTIGGELISLNSKTVLLKTTYGGLFTINKKMVASIYPNKDHSSILYSGPNDEKEWMIGKKHHRSGKFSVTDKTLILEGFCNIGMDVKLEDLSQIDFNFEVTGNGQLRIIFYADKLDNPKNYYSLSINSGYIYLQKQNGRSLGNVQCKPLRVGKGKITILTDRKSKRITLLVNGLMVKQWQDTEEINPGSFISFINQSQGGIKIKDIEVSKWNGISPDEKKSTENKDKDLITFTNGDRVTGKLLSINNDETILKTEYAELKIPLKRIKEIRTALKEQHIARKNRDDALLTFLNGNKITLKLLNLSTGKISGESENFGEKALELNAFKSLHLNIYREK